MYVAFAEGLIWRSAKDQSPAEETSTEARDPLKNRKEVQALNRPLPKMDEEVEEIDEDVDELFEQEEEELDAEAGADDDPGMDDAGGDDMEISKNENSVRGKHQPTNNGSRLDI